MNKLLFIEYVEKHKRTPTKVHISERDRCIIGRRILTLPFSPQGHERSPKFAPQHAVIKQTSILLTR